MNDEILESLKADTLSEFEALSRIYRPSFLTRKIADYLKQRVNEINPKIEVHEDAYRANLIDDKYSAIESSGNLWFDIPANAPGFVNNTPIILQAHMDMVISFEKDEDLETLKDHGVELEYHDNGTLTSMANRTTLGADDGIAIGLMLAILKSDKFLHGPIRCIITADEEVGMCGAQYLGLKNNGSKGGPVQGFNYLINIDNLTDGEIIVSTMGAVISQFMYPVDLDAKPLDPKTNVYTVEVDGLVGGHDGLNIEGHASAVWLVGQILKNWMNDEDFRLIEYTSPDSTFQNVLQKHSIAKFASNKALDVLTADMNKVIEQFKQDFPAETGLIANLSHDELDKNLEIRPYSHDVSARIMKLINKLPHGVLTWKDKKIGWLESCGNLGPIYLTYEVKKEGDKTIWHRPTFMMKSHFRSCNNKLIDDRAATNKTIAKECFGFDDLDYFQIKMIMYGWGGNKNASFVEVAKKAFEEKTVKWYACNTRSGLEVSWFNFYNKDINMISIGPECHHMHDRKETLYTETLNNTITVVTTCIEKMRLLK